MQFSFVIGSTLLCSALTAGLVSSYLQRRPSTSVDSLVAPSVEPSPKETEDSSAVQSSLAAFQQELDALRLELERARAASSRVALGEELSMGEVESTVRRLVAEEALREDEVSLVLWPGGAANASDAYQRIMDADSEEAAALWAEAAANGQLHDVLAAMEAHLDSLPASAENEFLRATSYYAAAGAFPGNQDGNWWVDSDRAFSRALEHDPEHDPEHWEARYQKARNQAFWPPAYGGQAEAVRHFELLAEQQERRTQEPRFADTYIWLGNLYDQQGRVDDAQSAWERGLALFPGNDRLTQKLATLRR